MVKYTAGSESSYIHPRSYVRVRMGVHTRDRIHIHAYTYTYLVCICKNQVDTTGRAAQRMYSRPAGGLSGVLTLFFYQREHDVHSFDYFRITALKAALRASQSLRLSMSLSSSLCMHPHFPLGGNVPNRSPSIFLFARQPFRVDMAVGWNRSFAQRESTAIRFESISYAAEADDIGEMRTWSKRGPQELEKIDIGSNLRSPIS